MSENEERGENGRVVRRMKKVAEFPHLVHIVLSVATCGFWLWIYLIHYLVWKSNQTRYVEEEYHDQ